MRILIPCPACFTHSKFTSNLDRDNSSCFGKETENISTGRHQTEASTLLSWRICDFRSLFVCFTLFRRSADQDREPQINRHTGDTTPEPGGRGHTYKHTHTHKSAQTHTHCESSLVSRLVRLVALVGWVQRFFCLSLLLVARPISMTYPAPAAASRPIRQPLVRLILGVWES